MSAYALLAVFGGAGCGAVLRWILGIWLNPMLPMLPLGTLAANLLGGLLIGVCHAFFTLHAHLAPEWRLLAMTGFLGGLTTFSTFSAEVFALIARHEHLWAAATAGAHLFGSIVLTALGVGLAQAAWTR